MYKFMDFCAGIGGGRLGLVANGLACVAHSEIDEITNNTYKLFFGDTERNYGDLMKIDVHELPDFDILIGGFPCQTFSVMGQRKGFDDYRGQVIYGLLRIIKEKDIPYFILENVKGLVNHNGGKTLQTIIEALTAAGYNVGYKLLNSLDYGVPQMRERIYIVGIKKGYHKRKFIWPSPVPTPQIKDFLVDNCTTLDLNDATFQRYLNNKYNIGRVHIEKILQKEYTVIDTRQSDLRVYDNKCPTLRTGRHGILYVKGGKLHKLLGVEALLLQGFPFELVVKAKNVDNSKLLSQAGNAMTVTVIKALGKALMDCTEE